MHELHRCTREFVTASGEAYEAAFRVVIEDRENQPGSEVRKEREKTDGFGWEIIEAYTVTDRGANQVLNDEVTV